MADTVGSTDGGAWMSYDDLAKRLSMQPASARNLVRRKGWRRQVGNDGRALVFVPLNVVNFNSPSDGPSKGGAESRDQALLGLAVRIGALEAELTGEKRRSAELAADRDAWRELAQSLAKAPKWKFWK